MGGQLWQSIFMVILLVYQVKGFEPDDLELTSGEFHMHGFHDGYEASADLESNRDDALGLGDRPLFCYYKPDAGPCGRPSTRYYYDYRSNSCRVFIYGGCGGNQNRFLTRSMCVKICKPYV